MTFQREFKVLFVVKIIMHTCTYLFNDTLQVYWVIEDLFVTSNVVQRVQNPNITNRKYFDGNNQGFKIGIEYTFNQTHNKYKGQGASEDEKGRM